MYSSLQHRVDLFLEQVFLQGFVGVHPFADRQPGAEFAFDGLLETFEIPLFRNALRRDEAVDDPRSHLVPHAVEHLGDIVVSHQVIALAIDDRALVVGDIVIFKQLLSYIEVAAFHLALGLFDRARDHAGFDRLAALHAEPAHEILHAFAGENPHQVVFHRQVETRMARVALATGAPRN